MGGLRGIWPSFLEIGRNRPFSPFFCLFRPCPEGAQSTEKFRKRRGQKKKKDFSFLRTPEITEKAWKTLKKARKVLATKKPRNPKKQGKEDQDLSGTV